MIEDTDIIKAVKESGGLRDCAKKLGIHPSSLSKRMKKLNIDFDTKNVEAYKKELKARYTENSRKYTINNNAFSKPSYECAYWLGFLAADGSVNSSRDMINVAVTSKDASHLEKLLRFIGSDRPIISYYAADNNGNKHSTCSIQIFSHQIKEDLAKYGVVPNKSYKDINFLEFIEDAYKIAFLIGFIDGDGGIYKYSFGITCRYCMGKAIIEYFKSIGIESAHIRELNDNLLYISYSGKSHLKFCELYIAMSDYIPVLERKKYEATQVVNMQAK